MYCIIPPSTTLKPRIDQPEDAQVVEEFEYGGRDRSRGATVILLETDRVSET